MAIISISRGIASSGSEIAERLAHKLGYRLITGTDIEAKIVHYGFPLEKLPLFNEKRPLFWHFLSKERELYFNYLKHISGIKTFVPMQKKTIAFSSEKAPGKS